LNYLVNRYCRDQSESYIAKLLAVE